MKSPVKYLTDAEYTALPVQERALQFAAAQVGQREIGKNAGPFVTRILAAVGLGPGFPCKVKLNPATRKRPGSDRSTLEVEMQNEVTRFWSFVLKSEGCWIWTGWKKNGRYGTFSLSGKHIQAHRLSWEWANGPIPEGLCVLHRCDNPACVNPDHLFLGTHADNMRDMIAKGRRKFAPPTGTAHWRAKLDPDKVRIIRRWRGSRTAESTAEAFGVSHATIEDVWAGRTWGHVK